MSILTRDEILRAEDIKTEKVPVPEWGGDVLVRTLTGTERDRIEAYMVENRIKGKGRGLNYENLRARLVVSSAVDEKGARLFKRTDIETLGQKSAAALDRVFEVAQRLSGFAPKDVEELTKNS